MVAPSQLQVHQANVEQLRAWDGDEGDYWAAQADTFERSVAAYDEAFFEAASITATDHVLDVGCGTGSTTRAAATRAVRGGVLGVDLSSAMLAVARRRAGAEGLANVEFLQADAQVHPFRAASFDVAVSRTAAMFFADRVAALANVRRALRPGGRLVLLVWQSPERNAWFLELTGALAAGRPLPTPPPGAPHPFSMADPDATRAVLVAAGCTDVEVAGLERPMLLGPDPQRAYAFALGLLGWMLTGLEPAGQARARDALRATVDAHAGDGGVTFGSAAWLVTARAGASPATA
jgi:SAM-dependent methyltransferase